MTPAAVFTEFDPVPVVPDGSSIYDFLGVATDVRFKAGWARFALQAGRETSRPYPPLNEHYFDWILTLESVARASGVYRMAELGAGWGTWVVRAAAAARQRSQITRVELLAIEADRTHYEWMLEHFRSNKLDPQAHHVIHGAVAAESGTIRFPVLEDPAQDYGASTRAVSSDQSFVVVDAFTLEQLLERFDGPVDFLHIDMQGAEYDTLPPAMDLLRDRVKSLMIGTHISSERHLMLSQLFAQAGWVARMDFPRSAESQTDFGPVRFGDGLLAYLNPRFVISGATAG